MSDVFRENASRAFETADECRREAERQPWRRAYWLSEAARHDERADWYERRAFTPSTANHRDAA